MLEEYNTIKDILYSPYLTIVEQENHRALQKAKG